MKKLTKREYTKQMDVLVFQKGVAAGYVQKLIDNIENLNRPLTIEEGDKINALHDKVYDLQQKIEQLDFAFSTRNWNSSDWTLRDLITSNID